MAEVVSTGVSHVCDNSTVSVNLLLVKHIIIMFAFFISPPSLLVCIAC